MHLRPPLALATLFSCALLMWDEMSSTAVAPCNALSSVAETLLVPPSELMLASSESGDGRLSRDTMATSNLLTTSRFAAQYAYCTRCLANQTPARLLTYPSGCAALALSLFLGVRPLSLFLSPVSDSGLRPRPSPSRLFFSSPDANRVGRLQLKRRESFPHRRLPPFSQTRER